MMRVTSDTMFSFYKSVFGDAPFPFLVAAYYLGGYLMDAADLLDIVRR